MKRILLLIAFLATSVYMFGQLDFYIDIGTKSSPFFYTDTQISTHSTGIGYYYLTITTAMNLTISYCKSTVPATGIFLLNSDLEFVAESVGSDYCSNPKLAYLEVEDLEPGFYTIWVDWSGDNGKKAVIEVIGERASKTNPEGNTMQNAMNPGSYKTFFSYTDTKDMTSGFTRDYPRSPDTDVFYEINLSVPMEITISHCGSTVGGSSTIFLLDLAGKCLADSYQSSDVEICDERRLASLYIPELKAGSYFIVSSGREGELTTQIQGIPTKLNVGSSDQNYISTRTFTDKGVSSWHDKIDYYDGMGRLKETVLAGASPTKNDVVTFMEYDSYGRESKSWLPAVVSNNNGKYVPASTVQSNSKQLNNDAVPFSLTEYEASPLKRVSRQFGAGSRWHSNNHAVGMNYLTNISGNDTLNCIHYKVKSLPAGGDADTLVQITRVKNYDTGSLYVTRTIDEDRNTVLEFKNFLGQVVLTRQLLCETGSSLQKHDTYYIYDDWQKLIAVLPPLASDRMKSGTSWSNKNDLCLLDYAYLYRYDKRGRCIARRLPGAGWTYQYYDGADRLIFTQDPCQRAKGEWLFNIPDVFGRVCLSGVCENTLNPFSALPDLTAIYAERDDGIYAYNKYAVRGISLYDFMLLSTSYYDDYSFIDKGAFPSFTHADFKYEAVDGFGKQHPNASKGMLTGKITLQLIGAYPIDADFTIMYYDERKRLIQEKSTNHLGGYDKVYTAYNFTGSPTRMKKVHTAPNKSTQTELYTYTYDHMGRLLTTTHKLNSNSSVTLASNEYDELGRLKASTANNQSALRRTYSYNLRSWMESVSSTHFTQQLTYTHGGNISTQQWTQDGKTRKYTFSYDNLSRLKAADYTGSASYSTSYRYDKHGNITGLIRYGNRGTSTYGIIDNLTLGYNGNQLIKVEDTASAPTLSTSADFRNGSTADVEYFYDANGSMTKDLNKGISRIEYNLLNLPHKIVIGSATNSYIYNAEGRKLSVTKDAFQTDYVGNVIYENNTFKRLLVDGGYVENGVYHFYISDHLGNNRIVADRNGSVVQSNQYYPFGMPFADGINPSKQPYKYNGKEFDMDRGLNLYDYVARGMDPALGRFMTMDPLAEKYYWISPYAYCANNPMNAIDPTGKDIIVLRDPKGAGGFGHAALLVGNDTEGWQYVSKDGTNGIGVAGPSDVGTNKFPSIEKFNNSEEAKKSHGYQSRVRFATTEEQDKAAYNAMLTAANSRYGVLTKNCMDAVSRALGTAGLHSGTSIEGSDNPYSNPISDYTPIPNIRYKRMVKHNQDEIVDQTENANPQYNRDNDKGGTWNDFINALGRWLIENPNIQFFY